MKYQQVLDKLEDMHDESAKEYLGSNEADIDFKEKVARWIVAIERRACESCEFDDNLGLCPRCDTDCYSR